MNSFDKNLSDTQEYGVVSETRHPLVVASGIPDAALDEVVVFENESRGYITGLHESQAEISLLSHEPAQPGMKLTRTGRRLEIPVGDNQRGETLTPLGELLESSRKNQSEEELRLVDVQPPHIAHRAPIADQFLTGLGVVDLLVPLAAGQREAVIGDQKTGKTSFLLAAAKAHAERGGMVVYAAIGRPWSEIRRISDFLKNDMPAENAILVASGAKDVASLVTITPYSAMTIAEYWRDKGEDVLLILQDLSTHARYYREVALLAQRFPGRESYPGDIFHAHARLLERAGNFKHSEKKSAAITCLVVGETVQSDVSSYIISNLISITDGHLLFDTVRFSEGQRPAVDVAGSVTRVGRKVQAPLAKKFYLDLIAMLARYEEAQQFSRFGTELSEKLKKTIAVSERLLEFYSQPAFFAVPQPVQLVMVGIIWQEWLADADEGAAGMWRDRLVQHYNGSDDAKKMMDELVLAEDVPSFLKKLQAHKDAIVSLCQSEEL